MITTLHPAGLSRLHRRRGGQAGTCSRDGHRLATPADTAAGWQGMSGGWDGATRRPAGAIETSAISHVRAQSTNPRAPFCLRFRSRHRLSAGGGAGISRPGRTNRAADPNATVGGDAPIVRVHGFDRSRRWGPQWEWSHRHVGPYGRPVPCRSY